MPEPELKPTPQPRPQSFSENDTPGNAPSRAGTATVRPASTAASARAANNDTATAANAVTATDGTENKTTATAVAASTAMDVTSIANAANATTETTIAAAANTTSGTGSSSAGVEVTTEQVDEFGIEKATAGASEESEKHELTEEVQETNTQPPGTFGNQVQAVGQPTSSAATYAVTAAPEGINTSGNLTKPTSAEQVDVGISQGKSETKRSEAQSLPAGEGTASGGDGAETQTSASPYETLRDFAIRAIRAGVVRRQMMVKGKFAQYRRLHQQYVGSDHHHRRARVIVQRGLKEVYRIRKRVAKQIIFDRDQERLRLEQEAREEAYRQREMRVVKVRERHVSAIRRQKRPHLVMWPVQLRHPAFYKRRNVRDLATRWNHPQAHPASFHLKSPAEDAIRAAAAEAEATGQPARPLQPTKSRVTLVLRSSLLNAETFHPASVSAPSTVSTIRRRTHDPRQCSPVFYDYKLHVVPPGIPSHSPRATIISSSKLKWTWGTPQVDGGARVLATQVRVSPWTMAQQPQEFEGIITSFITPDHFIGEQEEHHEAMDPTARRGTAAQRASAAIQAGQAVSRPVVPGIAYRLQVRFRNHAGWGPWSAALDPAGSPPVDTRVVFHGYVCSCTEYPAALANSKPQPRFAPPDFDLPRAVRNDAVEIHNALADPCFGNMPENQLQLHLELPAQLFRQNLIGFCRKVSASAVADRASVFLYLSGQACFVPDTRPMFLRKKALLRANPVSKHSTYMLCADSVLTGKRSEFEAQAISEVELAEILREYLHVQRCCIVLDLAHFHGVWRDSDPRKKLRLSEFGGPEVCRGVHKSFMDTLENILSVKEQRLAWREQLQIKQKEFNKELKRQQQQAKKQSDAAARPSDQIQEGLLSERSGSSDVWPVGPMVCVIDAESGSVHHNPELYGNNRGDDTPSLLLQPRKRTYPFDSSSEDRCRCVRISGVASLAEGAAAVVRHLPRTLLTPVFTKFSVVMSSVPTALGRAEKRVRRIADMDTWRREYDKAVEQRARLEARDQERYQKAVIVAKRKRKPVPPPPAQRPPAWHYLPPPAGSIVLMMPKPRQFEADADEEQDVDDDDDIGGQDTGEEEQQLAASNSKKVEVNPDKLAELERKAAAVAAAEAAKAADAEEERINPRPFAGWGHDPDELYWQGATGRQLKISDDEQLQREMEKAAAEEAMHEGGGRARFHLKDDSDSGQEDEDDYANYNDQSMTVFGTSILRFLRPRRPVLADPLLQAVLAHNPGGVDFGRAVSYLERALPGASNEWTEAMVTSRPLAFGIHSWVRVRILERVELSPPTAYLVRYPVTLRQGQSLHSAAIAEAPIPKNKRLLVDRVVGRRAHIVWPVEGWCSMHSKNGIQLLVRAPEEPGVDDMEGRVSHEVQWRVEIIDETTDDADSDKASNHDPGSKIEGAIESGSSMPTVLARRKSSVSSISHLFRKASAPPKGTGETLILSTKELRPGPLLAGLLNGLQRRRRQSKANPMMSADPPALPRAASPEKVNLQNTQAMQEHNKRLANEVLADNYLAAKFDTTEVAEEKNAIVAVEEESRAMALEAAVPMWLRVGAIVQARIVKADRAFCCAPVRIPKPGVPFAVCSTSTSITIEWDVESLIGDPSNGEEIPPIEYFQIQIRNVSASRLKDTWMTLPLAETLKKMRRDAQQGLLLAQRNATDAALNYFNGRPTVDSHEAKPLLSEHDAVALLRSPTEGRRALLPPNRYCARQLLHGEAYQFRVRACSAAGCGPYSRASVSINVQSVPVPSLATDLYFASTTPSVDIFRSDEKHQDDAMVVSKRPNAFQASSQVNLLQLLLDRSIGGGHATALQEIMQRINAVLSNDFLAPPSRRQGVPGSRPHSVCHRLLVTRAEPVSRFEKEIGWLRDRGPEVPTLEVYASDRNASALDKLPARKPPTSRPVRRKVDLITALLCIMGEFCDVDGILQNACRCIGLAASIAGTSRAKPARKFGAPSRPILKRLDKAAISAARVLFLTPMRGASLASITTLLPATQATAKPQANQGKNPSFATRKMGSTLRHEAERIILGLILSKSTSGDCAGSASAGTVAAARWAIGRLRSLDAVRFKPPRPPPKNGMGSGSANVSSGKLQPSAAGARLEPAGPLTPGDIVRHTTLSSNPEDVFQLPLPSVRYDADSDTSSTGFEGTDGDQYGSDGEAQFDPFWSTSESDGEDNDALAIHTLLADTTFNDEIAADELDLLQDLELEQQKIEHELRVAKVGNIVDSLGNSVSRSQVQQALRQCNNDVDSAIKMLAPLRSMSTAEFARHQRQLLNSKSSESSKTASLRSSGSSSDNNVSLEDALVAVDAAAFQRLRVQVRHLRLEGVADEDIRMALRSSHNSLAEALGILMRGRGPNSGLWSWEEEEKARDQNQSAKLDFVSPDDVKTVAEQLRRNGLTQIPSEDAIVEALKHVGGHIGKAINRLNALLTARSHVGSHGDALPGSTDSAAVKKVLQLVSQAAGCESCSEEEAAQALEHAGGHVGKAVNWLNGLLTARSQVHFDQVKSPESDFPAENIESVLKKMAERQLMCTADEATAALRHTNGHVGKAVNHLNGMVTARSQVEGSNPLRSPSDSIPADVVAFDGEDVRNLIAKLAARGMEITEQEAMDALQATGGHVGKAINSLVGQLTARAELEEAQAADAKSVAKVLRKLREDHNIVVDAAEVEHALQVCGGHVGKAVNRIRGLQTARSQVALESTRGNAMQDGSAGSTNDQVQLVMEKMSQKGLSCTVEEAASALNESDSHVGRAVNRLAGLLTARSQVSMTGTTWPTAADDTSSTGSVESESDGADDDELSALM